MGIIYDIIGNIENFLHIGIKGPQIKNNAGIIEVKDYSGANFAKLRAADPVGPEDVMTKGFFDQNICNEKTITVKATGGDFDNIQDAVNYFAGKFLVGENFILVDPGVWAGFYLNWTPLGTGQLTIKGDVRDLGGYTFVHDVDFYPVSNAGIGVSTITKLDDYVFSITRSMTNPDFTDWGSGDRLMIVYSDNTKNWFTIDSIDGTEITLTDEEDPLHSDIMCVTFVPNREISNMTLRGTQVRVNIQGFHATDTIEIGYDDIWQYVKRECTYTIRNLFSSIAQILIRSGNVFIPYGCVSLIDLPIAGGMIEVSSGLSYLEGTGIFFGMFGSMGLNVYNKGIANLGSCLFLNCSTGMKADSGGYIKLGDSYDKAKFVRPGEWAILADGFSSIRCSVDISAPSVVGDTKGINAIRGSTIYVIDSVIDHMDYAVAASDAAIIYVEGIVLTNNTNDYDPTTSGTPGNNNAVIIHP